MNTLNVQMVSSGKNLDWYSGTVGVGMVNWGDCDTEGLGLGLRLGDWGTRGLGNWGTGRLGDFFFI